MQSARLQPVKFPEKLVFYSDFDGTISDHDSLKLLLNFAADPQWKNVESRLSSGNIHEREGLQTAFDCLQMSFQDAKAFVLENVKLDPQFKAFYRWVQQSNYELVVLSGGLVEFIQPLFEREGLGKIKVLANASNVEGERWKVIPNSKVVPLCPYCNHCKSASLLNDRRSNPENFIVYIGDGHTDTCPVQLADLIFAKGHLQRYCEKRNLSSVAFNDFGDIQNFFVDWQNQCLEFSRLSYFPIPKVAYPNLSLSSG